MFLKDPSPNADCLCFAMPNYFFKDMTFIFYIFMYKSSTMKLKSAPGKHPPDFQNFNFRFSILSQHANMTEEFTLHTTSTCRYQFILI